MTVQVISALSLGVLAVGASMLPHLARLLQQCGLRRRCARTRSLVLTYDDGPGMNLTPRLLDLLADRGCKATFFLLGMRAVENASIIDRMISEGHEVGCHTHNHLNAWKTWPWRAVNDIGQGYRTLKRWVAPNGLFRPPNGKLSAATWFVLWRRRIQIGWWTVDSGDTFMRLPDSQDVVSMVQRNGGGVVLMHDFDRTGPGASERADFVLRTTEQLLTLAKSEGLSVRCLGDLLGVRTTQVLTCPGVESGDEATANTDVDVRSRIDLFPEETSSC